MLSWWVQIQGRLEPGTGCVRRQGHFVHWGARGDVGHVGLGREFQQSADFGQELGQSADFGQELDESADLCSDWLPVMSAVVHSTGPAGL